LPEGACANQGSHRAQPGPLPTPWRSPRASELGCAATREPVGRRGDPANTKRTRAWLQTARGASSDAGRISKKRHFGKDLAALFGALLQRTLCSCARGAIGRQQVGECSDVRRGRRRRNGPHSLLRKCDRRAPPPDCSPAAAARARSQNHAGTRIDRAGTRDIEQGSCGPWAVGGGALAVDLPRFGLESSGTASPVGAAKCVRIERKASMVLSSRSAQRVVVRRAQTD